MSVIIQDGSDNFSPDHVNLELSEQIIPQLVKK